MPRREGHPVIGANRLRKPKFLECPLEDGERKFLLSCGQRFARQEIPGRIVGDRERITVLSIAELKLAFVVSAPEGIRVCGPRELGAGGPGGTTPATPVHQAVAIEDRVDRADRGEVDAEWLATQLLADLGRAPARIFTLQPDDHRFDGRREPIRLPIRPSAAIGKCAKPTVLVPLENLVAGLAGDPELRAQRRHLFALEQAGDKPQPLVHDVTLLPRHAPSCEGSKSVTHVSGILCYLSLRKDNDRPDQRDKSIRAPVRPQRGHSTLIHVTSPQPSCRTPRTAWAPLVGSNDAKNTFNRVRSRGQCSRSRSPPWCTSRTIC